MDNARIIKTAGATISHLKWRSPQAEARPRRSGGGREAAAAVWPMGVLFELALSEGLWAPERREDCSDRATFRAPRGRNLPSLQVMCTA